MVHERARWNIHRRHWISPFHCLRTRCVKLQVQNSLTKKLSCVMTITGFYSRWGWTMQFPSIITKSKSDLRWRELHLGNSKKFLSSCVVFALQYERMWDQTHLSVPAHVHAPYFSIVLPLADHFLWGRFGWPGTEGDCLYTGRAEVVDRSLSS